MYRSPSLFGMPKLERKQGKMTGFVAVQNTALQSFFKIEFLITS